MTRVLCFLSVAIAVPVIAATNGRVQTPAIEWSQQSWPVCPSSSTYPRACVLADQRLLAVFERPTPSGRALACRRSRDKDKTFAICEDVRGVDLANPFPLQLPNGTILVAYRRNQPNGQQYSLEVHASTDDGESWTHRGTIATGKDGLWEPFLFLLPDGTVQVYYASEEGCRPDQRIEMKTSQNGGRTWSQPVTVASKRGSRDGMPAVVQLNSRELFAVFEAQDVPPSRFVIRAVRSTNLGKSWSRSRELVYQPTNPIPNRWAAGAPSAACLPNKVLLVSYQTDEDVKYSPNDQERDPAHPQYDYLRHCAFKYVASKDDGKSWLAPVQLAGTPDRPALWNSIIATSDDGFLALSNSAGRTWVRRGSLFFRPNDGLRETR